MKRFVILPVASFVVSQFITATSSHVLPPKSFQSGGRISVHDTVLSSIWVEDQIVRYLAKPLSFPISPDHVNPDYKAFKIPPQKEQKPTLAHYHLASKVNNSSQKYRSHDGGDGGFGSGRGSCPSTSASKGEGSPLARKRKMVQANIILRKHQKISDQAKDSLCKSKLKGERINIKVRKKLEKFLLQTDRTSYGNQEEKPSESLTRFINLSADEHLNEVPDRRNMRDIYEASVMHDSNEFPTSSMTNARTIKEEHDQVGRIRNLRRNNSVIEARKILFILQQELKMEDYPTFSNKIQNKLKSRLEQWKKCTKTTYNNPSRVVSRIRTYIKNVTKISVFLIMEHISHLLGQKDEINIEIEKLEELLDFMNEFWDNIINNKVGIRAKDFHWISKIPEFLNPDIKISIKNYYTGAALWYITAQDVLRYWSKHNMNKYKYLTS
jgi:hypothetical protein